MKQVMIYIATNAKGAYQKKAVYGYVLECETAKGPATLTKINTMEGKTRHQIELATLNDALGRLKRECDLKIYTDSPYLAGTWQQGWVKKWEAAGWKNSRGEDVGNQAEWQETLALLKDRTVSFCLKEPHPYRAWLERELKKAEEAFEEEKSRKT